MKLFGLAGTAGSGKDTAAEIIAELFEMHLFSTSDYVRAVTRYIFDLEPDASPIRDQLFEVATELRKLNQASTVSMGVVQARERGFEKQLITGLRSVGEANAIRAKGGIIIGVDAAAEFRHARIQERSRDPEAGRTYDEFIKQDTHENEGVAGGDMRGIRYVIDEADIVIENNGTLEELREQIRAKMQKVLSQQS